MIVRSARHPWQTQTALSSKYFNKNKERESPRCQPKTVVKHRKRECIPNELAAVIYSHSRACTHTAGAKPSPSGTQPSSTHSCTHHFPTPSVVYPWRFSIAGSSCHLVESALGDPVMGIEQETELKHLRLCVGCSLGRQTNLTCNAPERMCVCVCVRVCACARAHVADHFANKDNGGKREEGAWHYTRVPAACIECIPVPWWIYAREERAPRWRAPVPGV